MLSTPRLRAAARRAYLSSKGDNYGGSCVLDLPREATQDTEADHAKARYSRTPNLDIAKVVQNRNGSALAQLGSVTQQRR